MLILTENQAKLLYFISIYRWEHGTVPTLQEMINGVGVSDNKSVLGIINALSQKGYLKWKNNKIRTITLTEKAQGFLNNYLIPFQYKRQPTVLDQLYQSSELGRSDVSVSLPISDFLSYKENTVKTDGTNLDSDLRTVVETAVSLAISKYFDGTQLTDQKTKEAVTSGIGVVIQQIFRDVDISKNFGWGFLLVALTWAFNPIAGNSLNAFAYSVVGTIIIRYLLTNKQL